MYYKFLSNFMPYLQRFKFEKPKKSLSIFLKDFGFIAKLTLPAFFYESLKTRKF